MITHCQICKRELWWSKAPDWVFVEPLPGDPRYCRECAIKACEWYEERMKALKEAYEAKQ